MAPDYRPAIKRLVTGIELYNGDVIPAGYGYAYRLWDRDIAVYMPIPVNLFVQFGRWVYYWARSQHFETVVEKAFDAGYQRGLTVAKDRHKREIEEARSQATAKVFNDLLRELDRRGTDR